MSAHCRTVIVDGEPVQVLGDEPMSAEALDAFAAVVRAAKARLDAEPPRPCRSPRCDIDTAHDHSSACSAACLCGMGES
ncbi:MAG: hypothetical protein K0R60_43 [Microbacterium sp.]|jgi:hypothetical protein|nr:hypothetical protein [Microbacterium sp.]